MRYFVKTAAIALGLSCFAGTASAQSVSQSQVIDEGGTGEYPVTVVGNDGLTYRCKRELVELNGQRVRYCIVNTGGLGPDAGGVGVAAAVLLGLVAVVASDDS